MIMASSSALLMTLANLMLSKRAAKMASYIRYDLYHCQQTKLVKMKQEDPNILIDDVKSTNEFYCKSIDESIAVLEQYIKKYQPMKFRSGFTILVCIVFMLIMCWELTLFVIAAKLFISIFTFCCKRRQVSQAEKINQDKA